MPESRTSAAVGLVIRRGDHVFLAQRRNGPEPGAWTPLWAPLEFGESEPRLYIRRKGLEVGLNVTFIRFAGITNDVFADQHYLTIWFRTRYLAGDYKGTEEWSESGWFHPKALPTPKSSPFQHLIRSCGYHFTPANENSPASIVELREPAEAFHERFLEFKPFHPKTLRLLRAVAKERPDGIDRVLRPVIEEWRRLRDAWRAGFTSEERGRGRRRRLRLRWDEW